MSSSLTLLLILWRIKSAGFDPPYYKQGKEGKPKASLPYSI